MLPEAFDYTDPDGCVSLVLELTGLKTEPEDLGGLLEVSAGIRAGEPKPVIRPYFVAAAALDAQLNQKRVRSLKGIVFDNPSETVAGLLRRQRMLDKALGLSIPDGMSAALSGGSPVFRTNRRRGWQMSVYEGLYAEYLLEYTAPGTVTEDDAGRPVEASEPRTVRAWFEPTRSPEVVRMVGADGSFVAVEGGLLGVETFPDGLVTGSEVEVEVGGRPYRLELILRPPSAFALLDELEGPRFYGRLHGPL